MSIVAGGTTGPRNVPLEAVPELVADPIAKNRKRSAGI